MGCSNGKTSPVSTKTVHNHGSVAGRKAEQAYRATGRKRAAAHSLHVQPKQIISTWSKGYDLPNTREADDRSSTKKQSCNSKGKYLGKINIRDYHDDKPCWITGIDVLSTSQLVVVDSNNRTIKVVNSESESETITKKTSDTPWDVAALPNWQFAVTFPDSCQIRFYLLDRGYIFRKKYLTVHAKCHGIAYQNNRLFISFAYPGKVQVLQMATWKIETTYCVGSGGSHIFDLPWYLAVSPNQNHVFVTDDAKCSVIQLSNDFKDKTITRTAIQTPWGIAVTGSGQLLVASEGEGKIYQISPDFSNKFVVLEEVDAQALCYCHKQKRLYMASNGSEHLHVYKI